MTAKNILLVDDDPQLRLALRLVLARAGYAVTEAVNGNDALRRFFAPGARFDVVVMDIVMPDKEGIETIIDLRRGKSRVPVIAMSGGGRLCGGDPLDMARQCGADYTIAKPFEPAALCRLVAQCLAG